VESAIRELCARETQIPEEKNYLMKVNFDRQTVLVVTLKISE